MKIDLNKLIIKIMELKKENKLYNKLYVKETKEVEFDSSGDKVIKQYFEDKE